MGAYNLGQITAALKLETRQFTTELDDVTRRFDRFLEVGFKVGEGLAKSFGGWLKMGIETNSMLDANTRSFTKLAGSEAKAVEFMGKLQSFAVATPFEVEGIADTTRTLQAMGVELDNTIPLIQVFGDSAASAGHGAERVKLLANAFTQVMAAGKLGGQELIQFVNNGVSAIPILTKAFDKSSGEIRAMMEAGELDSKTALSAILRDMVATSQGQMEQLSQTFGGRWTSIMETMKITSAAATKPLYDQLTALLPIAAAFAAAIMRAMGTLIPAVMFVVNGLGLLMVAFLSLDDATQNWVVGLTALAALGTFLGIVFASVVFTLAATLAAALTLFTFIGSTGAMVLAIVASMSVSFLALAGLMSTIAVAIFGIWNSEWFAKTIVAVQNIYAEFVSFLSRVFSAFQTTFSSVIEVGNVLFDTLGQMFGELVELGNKSTDLMLKMFVGFATGATKALANMAQAGMKGLLEMLKIASVLNEFSPLGNDPMGVILDEAIDKYSKLVDMGEKFGDSVADGVERLGKGIMELHATGTSAGLQALKNDVLGSNIMGSVDASFDAIAGTYMDAIKKYVPADFQAKAQNIINDFVQSTKLAPVDVEKLIESLFKDFKISPKKEKSFGFDKELEDMMNSTDKGLVSYQEKIEALFAADNISGAVDWTIFFNNWQAEIDKAAPLAKDALVNTVDKLASTFEDIFDELKKRYEALAAFNDEMLSRMGVAEHIDFGKNFQTAAATGAGVPGVIGNGVDKVMGAGAMAGPIGVIVGIILSLVTETKAFQETLGTLKHAISGIVSLFDTLLQALGPLNNSMNQTTDAVINMLQPTLDMIGKAFNGIGATLQPMIMVFKSVGTMLQNFSYGFEVLSTILNGVFFVVFNAIKVVALVLMGFQLSLAYLWNAIVNAIAAIVDLIPGMNKLADKIRTARAGTQNLQDQIDELMEMSYADAQAMAENAVATDTATAAMESMTEQLLNVPEGYKVALARFTAMAPEQLVAPSDTSTNGGGNNNGNNGNGDDKNYNENNHTITTPKDKNGDTHHGGGGATNRSAQPGGANKSSDNNTPNGSGSSGSSARGKPGFNGSSVNQASVQSLGRTGDERPSIYIENLHIMTENYDDFIEQLKQAADRAAFRTAGVPGTFAVNKFRKR